MSDGSDTWSKTVFRVRGIPSSIATLEDAARLLSQRLDNVPANSILVYSLATTLDFTRNSRGSSRSQIATVMFRTIPSLVLDNPAKQEWVVPAPDSQNVDDILLDTHFKGMTPLNGVGSDHSFDCIAISGLASHPFGSWQPKGGEKNFMWIRDALPNDLRGVRAILYGYDTRLHSSQSFQNISDLAQSLITHLQTYGWGLPTAKNILFLAHSLGGLVLREAMVKLEQSSNKEYKSLLDVMRGAVFFGVPNFGMEQSHFRMITHNNPNATLVEDIARNSNYLDQLNGHFFKSSFVNRLHLIWAYETSRSPTLSKTTDGKISRNGAPAILVSRDSATCNFIKTNSSITFPIDETHSDMVKFAKGSPYYPIIVSKLGSIMASPSTGTSKTVHDLGGVVESDFRSNGKPNKRELAAELDLFTRTTCLTRGEEDEFKKAKFDSLQGFIGGLQQVQGGNDKMMYLKRLQPFLESMKEYIDFVEDVDVFENISDIISYLWGPMLYILRFTQPVIDAFNSILDAYQEIGEQIPACLSYKALFNSKIYLRDTLVMLYKDVLDFHKGTIQLLKQLNWQRLFQASWRDFAPRIAHASENLRRHRNLLESGASLENFEIMQGSRQKAVATLESQTKERANLCQQMVKVWLCPFDCDIQQNSHILTRSICKDPGRWLLEDRRLRNWLDPDSCLTPSLWLNGNPGAGKTILASTVVDEARRAENSTVAFFYCKHNDNMRNSFMAVARSVLAQILTQNPHLLPYFHEKAYRSHDTVLASSQIAEEMLQTTLRSCGRVYLVIDGLDECGRVERAKISELFLAFLQSPDTLGMDSVRCLFVSQDDGIARKTLGDLPTIRVTTENKVDIKEFASEWHRKIEAKFGALRTNGTHIANIISAKAQGMFIYAEVFAKYLERLPNRAALIAELDPDRLPVKVDDVYARILNRIHESREGKIEDLHLILGWIVCAKRPLRWHEIQGAVSINMEQQQVDYDRKFSSSPKEILASFIELESDGTVRLIHESAREYLERTKFIQPKDVEYSLSLLSLAYLAFPEVAKDRSDEDIEGDLRNGTHAFYDYSSACWAVHLQAGIPVTDEAGKLELLLETLDPFVELHWSAKSKSLKVSEKVHTAFSHIKAISSPEIYHKLSQAVECSRKQLQAHSTFKMEDEALDLWQVTAKLRSVLEDLHSRSLSESELQQLQQFYGRNWFKCPRVSCYYYHHGFSTAEQRKNHVDRHERPFLCVFDGCQMKLFGCPTEDELKKHVLEWHGIDPFDGNEYPVPQKPRASSSAKNPATFQCPQCPEKKYTRKANLDAHLRTHDNIRPFKCVVCGDDFTRKTDCDRHEKGHGDKKFMCLGKLNDGSTWGCKVAFSRNDKLADHLKSKTGLKCIKPLLLQKLREGGEGDGEGNLFGDEMGTNADALLAAGRLLPSFGEFLQLCGLDKSAITNK